MPEVPEAGVCVVSKFASGRSSHTGLLYCRHRSPCEARKLCVLACSASGLAQSALPSRDRVPRLVYAFLAVSVLLFVLHNRFPIGE